MNTTTAFHSGMRGKEKPPEKKGPKRDIRRISIEKADTGHIVEVTRHSPKAKKNEAPAFKEPERHAHSDGAAAKAHVHQLMDRMSSQDEFDKDHDNE